MVLKETLWVSVVGALAGAAASYGLSRYLQSLLFGVTVHDAVTFVLCPAILLSAAVLAAAVPGWRASRTDPALTLRED
jgi:putative ABC transport system permease protein